MGPTKFFSVTDSIDPAAIVAAEPGTTKMKHNLQDYF